MSNDASIITSGQKDNLREICDFCNPLRCRICERRLSIIPIILPLLAKNDLIYAKDLGRLARVNTALRRYICVDSSEDIRAHLLFKKWQSMSRP